MALCPSQSDLTKDITTSVLLVNNKAHMVTLDYTLQVPAQEPEEVTELRYVLAGTVTGGESRGGPQSTCTRGVWAQGARRRGLSCFAQLGTPAG